MSCCAAKRKIERGDGPSDSRHPRQIRTVIRTEEHRKEKTKMGAETTKASARREGDRKKQRGFGKEKAKKGKKSRKNSAHPRRRRGLLEIR